MEVLDTPTPTTTPAPETSSAASTPSSTPATSTTATTASTPPAVERPKDAKELSALLRKNDEAASATTPHAPLVTDPAAAATTPLTTAPTAGAADTNAKGPIPFEVHHTALENARTKAVADFKREIGPVANLDAKQREWMVDMAARMADPVAFHRWFGQQLETHPHYGQQLRTANAPAPVKPQPDVQVLDHQGNVVGMSFSAERQAELLAWDRQQMTGEFRQLLQPFQQEREQRIQQERQTAQQKELNTRADATLTKVNKILRMDTLSKEEQASLSGKLLKEMESTPDAIDAALAVFEREIAPKAQQQAEQAALDTQRKKAAGNTANGTGTAPATPRPKNAKELAAFMAAHPDA